MSVVILGLGRYAEEITEIVASISDVVIVDREDENDVKQVFQLHQFM